MIVEMIISTLDMQSYQFFSRLEFLKRAYGTIWMLSHIVILLLQLLTNCSLCLHDLLVTLVIALLHIRIVGGLSSLEDRSFIYLGSQCYARVLVSFYNL